MILIADSGSTKTDWYITGVEQARQVQTAGMNPYMQTFDSMVHIIQDDLLKLLGTSFFEKVETDEAPLEVYFYGAGCTAEKIPLVESALKTVFSNASIFVGSDLLGAARALCGDEKGIACILGTGSNSCLYDGCEIAENVSPLGFILGDEGSGAVLGKIFIGNCLKKQFADALCREFLGEYNLTVADIINKVYREPMPNRFLASFCPFIYKHRREPEIHQMLDEAFTAFFKRNVSLYRKKELPVNFVGSVAYFYQDELKQVASREGYHVGTILRSPIEGLLRFHTLND